jgi:protein tyrosine kinase
MTLLAIPSGVSDANRTVDTPLEGLARYVLLRPLPCGLRSEVGVGVARGAEALSQAVVIKRYFRHAPGAALDGLTEELELAKRLSHPNIARTLAVGIDADRAFVVSEYLEGVTLQALLRRVKVAGAVPGDAAVARILLAIVYAVAHAGRHAASAQSRAIVDGLVAAEDVFITHDGAVKLLGFKYRFDTARKAAASSAEESPDETSSAAIDALLSMHLTPPLRVVLATATSTALRPFEQLLHVGRVLAGWQTAVLGSDGRAELAALVDGMFPSARLQQRARLDVAIEGAARARVAKTSSGTFTVASSGVVSLTSAGAGSVGLRAVRLGAVNLGSASDVEDEAPPHSGWRLSGSTDAVPPPLDDSPLVEQRARR